MRRGYEQIPHGPTPPVSDRHLEPGTGHRAPADSYRCPPTRRDQVRLINTSDQDFMNGPSYRPNKLPGRAGSTPDEDTK
jgi:hypothetical protein